MLIHSAALGHENQSISVDDLAVNYVDVGEGPALIMVHGLGADLTRFERNIDFLAQGHRVIALDLPGFGQSDRTQKAISGQFYINVIESLRVQLDLGEVTLIGNSMGGWLSLLYAKNYAQHVRSLILIAPAFIHGLPSGITPDMIIKGAKPETLAGMSEYLKRVLYSPDLNTQKVAELLQTHTINNSGDAISAIAHSLANEQYILDANALSHITTPILLIHGDTDGIVSVSSSKNLTKLLPNALLRVINKSGHWPQWENAKTVNKLMADFLISLR